MPYIKSRLREATVIQASASTISPFTNKHARFTNIDMCFTNIAALWQQGYQEVAFHSVRLVLWWEACGFAKFVPHENHSGKGYSPHIPDALLYSNDAAVYAAFIRGLFEADGTLTGQYVSFTTSSINFCHSEQTLLLSLGFTTTRKSDRPIGRWSSNLNHMRGAVAAGDFAKSV